MIQEADLLLWPAEAASKKSTLTVAASILGMDISSIRHIEIIRRSIDARKGKVKILVKVRLYIHEDYIPKPIPELKLRSVVSARPVLIAGTGPAGLFAALKLIELGFRPILFERGKEVQERRRDIATLNKTQVVNPDSNYCFGEGGAGTYSDGKLYTRASRRGDVGRILEILVLHGAGEEILIDAHPHVGTNKLPAIIEKIRENIIQCGGEFHFSTRVKNILTQENKFIGVEVISTETGSTSTRVTGDALILATGHSARDIYKIFHKNNFKIEAKPFALGLRVEHPQSLIDKIQYHCEIRDPYLPPSSYALTTQIGERGVYSFCMCPGGIIAPSSTQSGEIVVNGWSPSRRNNPFANSGIVVSVGEDDFKSFAASKELRAMKFQEYWEQKAFVAVGEGIIAPAQRLCDFVEKKYSETLPKTSYIPGVKSIELKDILPKIVGDSIRKALIDFGKKMKGYYTNEAVLVGTESRTSSPVRIPRDPLSLQHVEIAGIYPAGEGAGYAGGIVSAAMDGENCAVRCGEFLNSRKL